jgi:hypothetical protein
MKQKNSSSVTEQSCHICIYIVATKELTHDILQEGKCSFIRCVVAALRMYCYC